METEDIKQQKMSGDMPLPSIDEEVLVRRALLEEYAVPDEREEFQKFREYVNQKDDHSAVSDTLSVDIPERRLLPRILKYIPLIAAAACILIVFLLANYPVDKNEQVAETTASEHDIYIAKTLPEETILKSSGNDISYQLLATDHPSVNDVSYERIDLDDYVESSATVTVPQGKVLRIKLPDGSLAWLYAGSRLVYPERFATKGPRLVKLDGEAYFKVMKDRSHPFVVDCEAIQTKVLGTEFNVRHFSGEPIYVTLVTGSVEVTAANHLSQTLQPSQQYTYNQSRSSIKNVDTEPFIAWREGLFYFDNQTLRDVMTEIGRWYNMNITFEDLEYLDDPLHFSGDRSWTINQIVKELQYITRCRIRIEGNTIIVY